MPQLGDDLRGEMRRLRRHPLKWGNPRGLTHQQLADLATNQAQQMFPESGVTVSAIWVRQVESGIKGASDNTVGLLCYTLGIPVRWLRARGYDDIADVVAEWAAPGVTSHDDTDEPVTATEKDYLRNAPDLTGEEAEQLIETLRDMRRQEPFGKNLWRRRA